MIKSAIFEPNLLNMSPKSILLLAYLCLLGLTATAQYTEKINTNRPGRSQGAFSVGNNVLQLEGGLGFGKQKHKIRDTKTNVFYFDYQIRYGLLIEQLEINIDGRYRREGVTQTIGANEQKITRADFEYNTIGAKYLIYDPYKKPKKDSINLNSWREQHKFKLKSLIPAVSAYVGMNYVTTDNPFTFSTDPTISPKFVLMTQNNWWTSNSGSWVLVTNLIVDKITTDNPAYGWIITSTHTLNDKWAIFGEYQGQKSDFYSDNILRLGAAYLFNNDLQLDANITTNFKDTPSLFHFNMGASYRFDWHNKDEIIEQPGLESGIKEEENIDENEEEIDIDEREEIENDSLKLEKTPFINEFEDGSHREMMEKDLDERRTAERLERERIEQEKIDKKNDKKLRKEERRRLKREAKEAKQAEKAKIKAEKEKQKMIEDIDAELDKMEQDGGADDELKKIEEELKKLEEDEKTLDPIKEKEKPVEQEEDVDAAYDKLKKEQEKADKEEEKRRKKEEKKRLKEEKRKKKEEEKRKKQEEKRKKKEENDNNGG